MPALSSSPILCKVAALGLLPVGATNPTPDPYAFVCGFKDYLEKEAGFTEASACGFLQSLAELGTPDVQKRAGLWDAVKQVGNTGLTALHHPVTFAQGGMIANSSPQMAAAADHVAHGQGMSAMGDVASLGWDKLKANLPGWAGQAGDWAKTHLTPDNLKQYAPQVMAGLGTFAAGKLMGMGNLSSAAAGIAGGYGLPKLYDAASHMAGSVPAPEHPNHVVLQPSGAPAAAAAVGTQPKMDISSQGAMDVLHHGMAAPVQTPLPDLNRSTPPLSL